MCGRFTLMGKWQDIYAFLGVLEGEEFPPRYNIAPTQPILMAIAGTPRQPGSNLPDRQALLVRWGLIPAWAKDPKSMPPMFNARSETAVGLASFKAAFRHRRALVPASGFYEWMTVGKSKRPFFMRPRHGGLIAFAGLMETYADPNGSEIDTGAILTTAASDDIAAIHPRMPVVIQPEDFSRWLDCRTQEPRDVAHLLKPRRRTSSSRSRFPIWSTRSTIPGRKFKNGFRQRRTWLRPRGSRRTTAINSACCETTQATSPHSA